MKLATEYVPTVTSDYVAPAAKAEPNAETTDSFLSLIRGAIVSTVILTIICCGAYPVIIWAIAQGIFPQQANGSLVKKDGTATTDVADAAGSSLLGQNFSLPVYFHPRPSAAGNGYDATSSGGSNLGPLSDKLINGVTTSPQAPATQPAESLTYDGIRLRAIHYAVDNNIAFKLYSVTPDGTKTQVPLSKYQDAQGNLNDIALVDAFPHPTTDDDAKRTVIVAEEFATPIPADAVTASGSGLDPHISVANAKLQEARIAAARHASADDVEQLIKQHTDQPAFGFIGDPAVNVLMLNCALDQKYPQPAATQPAAK